MDENILVADARITNGKGAARQTRFRERVPGVFYLGHEVNLPFEVEEKTLTQLLRARHSLIVLEIKGDESRECVIRDIQRDPVSDKIIHIDLLGVKRGQKLTVTVQVRLIGTSIGVKANAGIMQHVITEVGVECLPRDIPSVIEVDISHLEIGQSVTIADIQSDKLKILANLDAAVAIVMPPALIKDDVVESEEDEESEEESEDSEES